MRLLRLALQAFGPFCDPHPTVVDFGQLSRQGLFSISGATGSGKSTLLDAICFALYGQTTGGEREARDMRSQHAPPTLRTFVELDFSLGTGPSTKRFRYHREPDQFLAASRGKGLSNSKHRVTIQQLDEQDKPLETLATQVPKARELTEQLLRLTVEQFRKVVILPQGKFAEILRDGNADQRKSQLELFDVLFETAWAGSVMDTVKAARKNGDTLAQNLVIQQRSLLGQVGASDRDDLLGSLDRIRQQFQRCQDQEKRIQDHRNRREADLTQARRLHDLLTERDQAVAELGVLESEAASRDQEHGLLQRAEAAARVAPTIQNWQRASQRAQDARTHLENGETQLIGVRQSVEKLSAEAATIPQLESHRDQWVQELESLNRTMRLLEEVTRVQGAVRQDREKLQASETQHRECLAKIEKLQGDRKQLLVDLELARVRAAQLDGANQRVQSLEAIRQIFQRFQQTQTQLVSAREFHLAKSRELEQSTAQRTQAEAHFRLVTDAFLACQAQILAENLQPGEACPVCGSLDHPQPAPFQPGGSVPRSEDLDAQARQVEEARKAESALRDEAEKTRQPLTQLETMVDELRTSLGDWAPRESELGEALTSAQRERDEARHAEKSSLELSEKLRELDLLCETELTRSKKTAEIVDQLRLSLRASETTLLNLQSEVPEEFTDIRSVGDRIKDVESRLDTTTGTIRKIQSEYTQCREALAAQESAVAAASQTLIQRQMEEKESRDEALAQLGREGFVDESGSASVDMARRAWIRPEELSSRIQIHQNWVHALAQGRSRVDRLRLEAGDQSAPPLQPLINRLDRAVHCATQVSQKVGSLRQQTELLERTLAQLDSLATHARDLLERHAILEWLDDGLGRGKLPGTQEVPNFREFVLGESLAPAVDQANLRFRRLTRGRYELRQKTITVTMAKTSGTDSIAPPESVQFLTPELRIHDTYLQKDRPVSTLSGGETFQLSMALALGLAESITQAQGGIQLDTVFIDEGFGTLDGDSLDCAIGVLTELRDMGRTVGVISHVEELHQRMTARLEVVKDADGRSRLRHPMISPVQ